MSAILISLIWPLTVNAASQSWPIGVEREVDEGVYMSVRAVENGWRVWRTETRGGVSCLAVKSAKGRPHPIPVGVGSALYDGTPFLTVSRGYQDKLTYHWQTEHYGRVRTKIRIPGDKFWDEYGASGDMSKYDGRVVEIVMTSWEYPEILVGLSEEQALFDFTGMQSIIEKVDQCEKNN